MLRLKLPICVGVGWVPMVASRGGAASGIGLAEVGNDRTRQRSDTARVEHAYHGLCDGVWRRTRKRSPSDKLTACMTCAAQRSVGSPMGPSLHRQCRRQGTVDTVS